MKTIEEIQAKFLKDNPEIPKDSFLKTKQSNEVWHHRNYRNSAFWINDHLQLLKMDNSFLSDLNNPIFEKFIIKSYALYIEIPNFIEKEVSFFKTIYQTEIQKTKGKVKINIEEYYRLTKDTSMKNHALLMLETHNLLKTIKNQLNQEELFLLTYLRHDLSHPILEGYKASFNKNEKGETVFDSKKFDKLVSSLNNKNRNFLLKKIHETSNKNIDIIKKTMLNLVSLV